jgi:hypothetical protein
MAEIKRSRAGQSFLTKPIGVVDVTTGADRAYDAKAKLASSVSDAMFGLAKTLQVKEGQDFADKVRVRKEDGSINYITPPSRLGRGGVEQAQKELDKKYNVALKQDALNTAAEFRQVYRDEKSFNNAYQEYIKTTSTELTRTTDEKFAAMFVSNAEAVRFEHSLDIKNKAFQAEQIQSRSQYETDMRNTIAQAAIAMSNGDVGEAEYTAQLVMESLDEDAISVFGLSGEKQRDLKNALSDSIRNARIQNAAKNYTLQDLVKLENAVKFRDFSDEKLKTDMPWLEDLISQSAATTQRANTLNVFVSGLKTARSSELAVSKQTNHAAALLDYRNSGQVFENNKAARSALDSALAQIGIEQFGKPIDTRNIFDPEASSIALSFIASAPFASNVLNRSFSNLAGSGVYDPEQIQGALAVYNNILNPIDYGLSDKNIEFMERLSSTLTNFGDDPLTALNLARVVRNNEPEHVAVVQSFYKSAFPKAKEAGVDIDQMASAWVKETMPGIRPNHVPEMATLAASIMVSDPASVETVLERTYDYKFLDSDYLLPSAYERSQGLKAKSRFAPEVFMNKDQLPKFDEIINNQLGRFSDPNLVFGENVFLDVVIGGGNTAEYRFVNKIGTPLQDASGVQPMFGSRAIKEFLSNNAAKQLRDAEFERSLFFGPAGGLEVRARRGEQILGGK